MKIRTFALRGDSRGGSGNAALSGGGSEFGGLHGDAGYSRVFQEASVMGGAV